MVKDDRMKNLQRRIHGKIYNHIEDPIFTRMRGRFYHTQIYTNARKNLNWTLQSQAYRDIKIPVGRHIIDSMKER